MTKKINLRWWGLWLAISFVVAGAVYAGLDSLGNPRPGKADLALRSWLLPGQTSHGHYQIELACTACHAGAFPSRDDVQAKCESCHAKDLKAVDDSHPRAKFTDPRNADRAALLDATYCVTCHVEHKPGITRGAGVTLPQDYCVICHKDVAKDRPSHQGMAFTSCTDAGCHNYHDNTALYEDFLVRHAGVGRMQDDPKVLARNLREVIEELGDYPSETYPPVELARTDADAGSAMPATEAVHEDWAASAHARSGVNCSACHVPAAQHGGDAAAATWVEKPTEKACAQCHGPEVEGFLAGLHGMRLKAGLPAMIPAEARRPMKAERRHEALGCTSCHAGHRFDTRRAAVAACASCHDDGHTRAYFASPHARTVEAVARGAAAPETAVTCATCHLPRVAYDTPDFVRRTLVDHAQGKNLNPPVKMARQVCLACHGLGYAIDALADPALRADNFPHAPTRHVNSIDMAVAREAEARAARTTPADTEATDPPGERS